MKHEIRKYGSFCLKGEVNAGYHYLKNIKQPGLRLQQFINRVEQRFFTADPKFRFKTRVKWIRQALRAYCLYFVDVLTGRLSVSEAEKPLAERLAAIVGADADSDIDELESILQRRFEKTGWHFLGGVTRPFRGPYIYENQQVETFNIELPLGTAKILVNFMHRFHMRSWLDFATFGKMGTGGWAKTDGLYCVADTYDIASESFRINYLKHEAQHFDDYSRFPFLAEGEQKTLEFRAKLVELIYSESPAAFSRFMIEACDNADFPHLQASFMIRTAMMEKLNIRPEATFPGLTDMSVIKSLAAEIFADNTAALHKRKQPC